MKKRSGIDVMRHNLSLYKRLIYESTSEELHPSMIPEGAYVSLLLGTSVLKKHVLYLIGQLEIKLNLVELHLPDGDGEEDVPVFRGIELSYGIIIGHIHSLGLRSYKDLIQDGKK